MAVEIKQGFLIKKIPYEEHHEIITIFTSDEILTLVALGTRKLVSKNARALNLFSEIEVEFFRARFHNRMSKLKRANLIKQIPYDINDTPEVIWILSQYIQAITQFSTKFYHALSEVQNYFGYDYNHHIKTYLLFYALDCFGYFPLLNQCSECQSHFEITSFELNTGGFLCKRHARNQLALGELKAWYALGHSFLFYKEIDAKLNKHVFLKLSRYYETFLLF